MSWSVGRSQPCSFRTLLVDFPILPTKLGIEVSEFEVEQPRDGTDDIFQVVKEKLSIVVFQLLEIFRLANDAVWVSRRMLNIVLTSTLDTLYHRVHSPDDHNDPFRIGSREDCSAACSLLRRWKRAFC